MQTLGKYGDGITIALWRWLLRAARSRPSQWSTAARQAARAAVSQPLMASQSLDLQIRMFQMESGRILISLRHGQ